MKKLKDLIIEKLKINKDSKPIKNDIDIFDVISYLNKDINDLIGVDFAGSIWLSDIYYDTHWKNMTDINKKSISPTMYFNTKPIMSKVQAKSIVNRLLDKVDNIIAAKVEGPLNGNNTYLVCIIYNYKADIKFLSKLNN